VIISKKSIGFNEVQIREIINNAFYKINESSINLDRDPSNKIYTKIFFSHVECYLNIYDDLCGTYLDGKIDKIRFKKNYKDELIKLVKDPMFNEYYRPEKDELKSKYKKTLKVFYKITDSDSSREKLLKDDSI
jgi:nicotinic acid phosphoribosyltransferase